MEDEDLPRDWVVKISRNYGKKYYVNLKTGETKWEKPQNQSKDKIRACHLLVKHQNSRRPSSWREKVITRTKEEAVEELKKYIGYIEEGRNTIEELAETFSDCNSAKNRGDLGYFERNMMERPFEEAAFALKVGEMSPIIETASGVHIIKRTA